MGRRKKGGTQPVIPDGKRLLALDVATATGYAFGAGGEILKYGKFAGDKSEPLGERLLKFSKWLSRIAHELPARPDLVLVELPFLKTFGKGGVGNVLTYAVLNRYIGVVQREVRRLWDCECEFVPPKDVKNVLGLKKGTHDQNKKRMVQKVNAILGTELKYKANRGVKTKASDDDEADAIAMLLWWWIKNGIVEKPEDG